MKTNRKDFSLRASEKSKDKEWFQYYQNLYAPYDAIAYTEEKEKMAALFEFLNNDISAFREDLNRMCNNLIDFGETEDLILPYNKIKNKFEILAGDYLTSANNHKILLMTAKAVKHKNDQFLEQINKSTEADLALLLEKDIETLMSMSEADLEKVIEEQRKAIAPKDVNYKNYLSDLEIYKNKMLKHALIDQEVDVKKWESYKHLFTAGGAFFYNGWKYGRPYFDLCNPLHCNYHLSSNQSNVEKGDFFSYSDEISLTHFLDEYMHIKSNKELKELIDNVDSSRKAGNLKGHYHGSSKLTRYPIDYNMVSDLFFDLQKKGLNQRDYGSYSNQLLRRTHLEFKAYEKVIFYTHWDEFGTPVTMVLNDNADIIPKNANKLEFTNKFLEKDYKYVWVDQQGSRNEAEICYIPRRYEVTSVEDQGVIFDYRKVPFQPTYVHKPYINFELSYKGGIMNATNATNLSLMHSALPVQLQIMAVKAIQNREISKYRGFEVHQDVSQIPDNLGANKEGEISNNEDAIVNNEIMAKKSGTRFFDGSRPVGNFQVPANRGAGIIPAQMGTSAELLNLQQFVELLDIELGITIGVPKSREGAARAGTNVTDNQQDIRQTSLHSQLYYFWLDKQWNKVLNEHLTNLDTYYRKYFAENPEAKEHLVEYITPDGTKELIKILPEYLDMEDTGLYMHNGYDDNIYFRTMLERIAQNTFDPTTLESTSNILKMLVSGASVEEVDREVKVVSEQIMARQQEQLKAQEEATAKQAEQLKEIEIFKHQLDVDKLTIKERGERETRLLEAEITSQTLANQYDIDKDKENDLIEKAKIDNETKEKINKEKIKSDEKINELKLKMQKEIALLNNKE